MLALVVSGCRFGFDSGPNGAIDEQGRLVVAAGENAGRRWTVTFTRERDGLCSTTRLQGDPGSAGGCWGGPVAGVFSGIGVGSGEGEPVIVDGIVSDQVAFVEIHSSVGGVAAPTVSLAPLGSPGRAFAQALPEGAIITTLIAFDAAGNEIGRSSMGPPPP